MKKDFIGKYLFYVGVLLLCVVLTVGLLSLLVEKQKEERKKASPGGIVEEERKENEKIRVVIKTNGFKNIEHASVELRAKTGLILHYGQEKKEIGPEEIIKLTAADERFQDGTIVAEPKGKGDKVIISSLMRGYGVPSYRGKLELYSTSKGVAIINELLLEEYLYAVVPSEMPSSYELEALKAQAVCARSYATKQARDYSYPEYNAHVDDSTTFQVYGNSKEQERTIQAVNETAGEKVWNGEEVATTYYFSTSCGLTTTAEAWGTKPGEANSYLSSVKVGDEEGAYEKDLPWYKWTAKIDGKLLSNLISANTRTEIGNLKSVKVTKRGPGNVALQIVASGDKGKVTVNTENKIRKALGGSGYWIEKQNGETVKSGELLPSAFFTIKKNGEEYIVQGGGYGHGIGMSQNGANEMAKSGKTYKEILSTFYQQIEVKK